jgi:YidC/Oxa1 family membrane protein insertase
MQMQMKIMMYIMPVFLLFFLNSYASGLSWYYFISNLLAVAQTLAFRYFIDDSKLEAQLHEVKKQKAANPKAKSKLSQWVEEQQKKQQGNSKK